MIGLSLTASVRTAEQDRDYWRERARSAELRGYDLANRLEPLFQQMSAWVTNEAGNITPKQAAQMFYAQDDTWQAAFFNVMQEQVTAHHAAVGSPYSAGVPAGEGQWYHVAKHLDRSGFETISAMFEHAQSAREDADA